MADQQDIVAGKGDMGGTMRLGSYPAELAEGSIVAGVYGVTRSTSATATRYEVKQRLPRALTKAAWSSRHLAGRPPGRVHRAGPRDPPVLRGDAGAPELKSRPDALASRCRTG